MSVSLDPALCLESANPNYTIGTFELFVTLEGGTVIAIGNIATGNFTFTPNIVEHRRGIDNSLDAIFAIGKDYTINVTADEVTARNLSIFLNEDFVNVAAGCKVPFTGSRCTREYGIELVHDFPCQTKTLTIVFYRAVILGEFALEFTADGFATFTGAVRSLDCSSLHPSDPFGFGLITGLCPTS
jgi:hypothetical protein